ncbi:acyl-CoA Delta-6 desaturase-like [Lineus longissimus]|uniref:acyl-CoA Delta-6 desaturase-like n=1 Tax=Lineus longissimus TaxID=88925 RepID=UPI002B4F199A
MGKDSKTRIITLEEVSKHGQKGDNWIVISGQVYDVTDWSRRHPGGSRLLNLLAGQDATEPFHAFHNDLNYVTKFLKAVRVGVLRDADKSLRSSVDQDFDQLRETARKMGLFEASYFFFTIMLTHVFILEALAYLNMWYCGTGWIAYIISVMLYTISQTQAGWLQHDFGHLSVFKDTKLDHFLHHLTMSFTKGASAKWWNHMHFQHHAKPNVIDKDPDVRLERFLVVGDVIPVEIARRWKRCMPYNLQHRYFFLIGPPLLIPVYFHYMIIRHVITRKLWVDFVFIMAYYAKTLYLYTPLLGVLGTIIYVFIVRCLDSIWFGWVSQSNHIPMQIDHDEAKPWLALQIHATCNVERSFFNDWFTGHLNFQIEHHLFPTMPRHNYYKMASLVKSLCEKHGIKYQVKPMGKAMADITRSLKHSGDLWQIAYKAYHLH